MSETTPADQIFERKLKLVEQSIDRHGRHLFNYLYVLTRQKQDAEDLLQDLWSFVLHKFEEGELDQFGLLRRKAYQLFIDFSRKKKKDPVTPMETLPERATNISHEPYSMEDEDGYMEKFFDEHGIDLKPKHKRAVWLYARYGMTYVEVAGQLGVSPNTIGDWIRDARKQFSRNLETS